MLIINNKSFKQNRTNINPYWTPLVIYIISHIVSPLMMNFNLFPKPWFNNFLWVINFSCTNGWLIKLEMNLMSKCLTFAICHPISFVGVWWQNYEFIRPALFILKALCQFPILNIFRGYSILHFTDGYLPGQKFLVPSRVCSLHILQYANILSFSKNKYAWLSKYAGQSPK